MNISREELLAWGGLVLGAPTAIAYFPEHLVVAGMIVMILVILLIIYHELNKPDFTVLCIEKILTINDREGKSASLSRVQTARANHKGITEFWCRNISADGSISNILIDNKTPDGQRTEAGDIQVCKRFRDPLKFREIFKMVLSYELKDSFTSNPESIIHVVEAETKFLRLVALLPKDRLPKSAKARLRYGGANHKELSSPKLSGERIEFELKRPKLGAEYCLEWEW